MAAPAFRSNGLGGTTTTTSTTITKPSGLADTDTLYAIVCNGGAASAPSTVPSGWTLTDSATISTTFWAGIYEKKITNAAGEPANYTWSGFTNSCAGAMIAVSGADTTTPTHLSEAQPNTNTNVSCASITTTVAECLIIGAVAVDDNQGVTDATWACATDPASLTERAELLSSGGVDTGVAMATAAQSATGATGALTATLAGTRDNVSFLIAVQPPQGATTVTGTASAAFTATATAGGQRTVRGTASATLTVGATEVGQRTVLGQATAPEAFTASVSGQRTVLGQSAAAIGASATAVGVRTVAGAAAATPAFTATALGTVTPPGPTTVLGAAAASLAFAAVAGGARTVLAQATAAYALTADMLGRRTVIGQAAAAPAFTAQSAGQRSVSGTAAGQFTFAAVAEGETPSRQIGNLTGPVADQVGAAAGPGTVTTPGASAGPQADQVGAVSQTTVTIPGGLT